MRKTLGEAGLSRAWEGLPQTFKLSLHGATGGGGSLFCSGKKEKYVEVFVFEGMNE